MSQPVFSLLCRLARTVPAMKSLFCTIRQASLLHRTAFLPLQLRPSFTYASRRPERATPQALALLTS